MSKLFKTKEVSEELSVNPTTVQRWVKYFALPCETNEHGHYFFTAEQVELLQSIKSQLNNGKKLRDVEIQIEGAMIATKTDKPRIATDEYEQKLEQVLERVMDLEQRLSQKADEVVSYQLLKHRAEIEDMVKMLNRLETRLESMESKVAKEFEEAELPLAAGGEPKKRWRTFVQMFIPS
ncbi:chromosome-anchoring protein racA [Alkalihalobacillus alcalophilus ATCC 27647 = CGMCC 1.3604]|uniref:Chromosome-anchoring protein RacA n=1 Tax=Alkalihalobacillus alcalophilus ATCC 27647 = CGMCC 1.3604 TaxID=1218173 RepID=A0A094WQL3_ALKAL|nr:chromosome-anchoring protein RacA [Alkalihalobacillus alcalophilus]KGA99096.1 RacA protein [Alkalihalobacillus alcalophilus ATCC 27647 = CGMCC 1.3604]MED1563481.1 chromosome-anchoring protein RacA [Alkalihalobacillus alcalophilus]THG90297.1 chromosome-anchoring protein racA [Alkalihalobacillus alcalophilus ATCC 27647 = CGMCC 1.3604]